MRMPLPTPTLKTDRLLLRPFSAKDLESIFALQSSPHILRYWDSPAWKERSQAQLFLEGCIQMAEEGTGARLVIENAADGAFLGWCHLSKWNPIFRSASMGYCFHEHAWGRGFATEATGAVLDWGFHMLPLNRVQAEVDTRNIASSRVLEKLGFTREGTLREDCIVDGVISDSWVYGLLRRDWERHRGADRQN